MSKRKKGKFERKERDSYMTIDPRAARFIEPFIRGRRFIEPCAGDGKFAAMLEKEAGAICVRMSDIHPLAFNVKEQNALTLRNSQLPDYDFIVSNTPWTRVALHELIRHFITLKPTWLLFDADWLHTKQSIGLVEHCHEVVSVGRMIWIEGSKTSGYDNCMWALFKKEPNEGFIKFYDRNLERNSRIRRAISGIELGPGEES